MHLILKQVVSRRLADGRTRRARRFLIQNATHPNAGYVNSLVDWFELRCFWGTCPKRKKKAEFQSLKARYHWSNKG